MEKIKKALVGIVAETLTEPRSGSLEGVAETVDILAAEFAGQPGVLKTLVNVYYTDYTTALQYYMEKLWMLPFLSVRLAPAATRGFP